MPSLCLTWLLVRISILSNVVIMSYGKIKNMNELPKKYIKLSNNSFRRWLRKKIMYDNELQKTATKYSFW